MLLPPAFGHLIESLQLHRLLAMCRVYQLTCKLLAAGSARSASLILMCNVHEHKHLPSTGSASAIDFQQPLALPPLVVEWARVAEEQKPTPTPDEVVGDLTATPADIADAVNPANDGSPAQGLANKVIESVQPSTSSSAQKLSDALGNPATDVAPKLQDAIEQPVEMLKPGREVSKLKL